MIEVGCSCTVSDIPSYTRLPEGDGGNRLRGQFLEDSAVALVEQLKRPSMQLEYSRNFFEQVVIYELPLKDISQEVNKLHKCLCDADLR